MRIPNSKGIIEKIIDSSACSQVEAAGEDAVAYVRNAVDEKNRQLTLITFNRRKED